MTPSPPKSDQAAGPMPIAWALAVPKLRDAWTAFEREKADAACLQSWPGDTGINAMMIGLTILAVLTFIAIGEIRRTQGPQLTSED
jgi:hypothetical protein